MSNTLEKMLECKGFDRLHISGTIAEEFGDEWMSVERGKRT